MKKSILLFGLFSLFSLSITAQDFTKASDSDPEATAILKQLKSKYESYGSMQASFTLEINIPEQAQEVQQGTISRSGDKYRFEVGKQTFISDGTTLWIILGQNKEVQINNVPEEEAEEGLITPNSIFNFYESDDFAYYLTNEMKEGNRMVQQIEFKPLDEYAEYSKIRMTVDKNKREIIRLVAFGKDATRYTFKLKGLEKNPGFLASHFTFNESDYPGYNVVDLR